MIRRDPQVAPGHYDWGYSHKARWSSYWHQIDEVLAVNPATCLEVGSGAGIVEWVLRSSGVALVTVDIDERLGVDRVGSVTDLPAEDGEFDVVLCAQVLEHLPWDQFPVALQELARVADKRVVVSLPQCGRPIKLDVTLPTRGFGGRSWQFLYRAPSRAPYEFDGQHYWEVGSRGAWPGDVRMIMEKHFIILREYIVTENMYHRFYVLEPQPAGFAN